MFGVINEKTFKAPLLNVINPFFFLFILKKQGKAIKRFSHGNKGEKVSRWKCKSKWMSVTFVISSPVRRATLSSHEALFICITHYYFTNTSMFYCMLWSLWLLCNLRLSHLHLSLSFFNHLPLKLFLSISLRNFFFESLKKNFCNRVIRESVCIWGMRERMNRRSMNPMKRISIDQ